MRVTSDTMVHTFPGAAEMRIRASPVVAAMLGR